MMSEVFSIQHLLKEQPSGHNHPIPSSVEKPKRAKSQLQKSMKSSGSPKNIKQLMKDKEIIGIIGEEII